MITIILILILIWFITSIRNISIESKKQTTKFNPFCAGLSNWMGLWIGSWALLFTTLNLIAFSIK